MPYTLARGSHLAFQTHHVNGATYRLPKHGPENFFQDRCAAPACQRITMRFHQKAMPQTPSAENTRLVQRMASKIYSDDASLADWTKNYLREHQSRLATDLDLTLKILPAGCRVLDVGAAPLATSAALQTLGFEVEAIDLDPERFASVIADFSLKAHRCDIENEALPIANKSVGAVLFNELFEHLRINPIFTLSEVFRVLEPGGYLLLSTPNLRSFRGIRNLLIRDQGHAVSAGVYRQYEKLKTLGHMGHVREYTRRETVDFLDKIGFVTETIYFRGGYGHGLVGLAEKLAPSMRPFFSVIARRPNP